MKTLYAKTLLTLLTVLPQIPPAQAGEAERQWPQWRGPHHNGVAPHSDPPTTWSETENVRFKVEVPGRGLASPIVWGDKVFLLTAVAMDPEAYQASQKAAAAKLERKEWPPSVEPVKQAFLVLALSRRDGSVAWRRTATERVPHESHYLDSSFASASPVTDGERLFAHFGSNGLYAYDLEGELLWSVDLGDMTTRRGFGEGSSPALHGDTLVVNWDHEGDSFIVALDARSGEQLWRTDRPGEVTSWSTPLVVESGAGLQVVVAATGRSRGYDLETGQEIWSAAGMTVNTIPTPVHSGGIVYLTSGYRGNLMQAIALADARGPVDDAAVVWTFDRHTPYVPSPVLYEDRICFLKHFKNIFTCLDAGTGEVLYTEKRLEGITNVYASPVAAAGRIYIFAKDGRSVVLGAGREYQLLATNALDDGVNASPAIAGDEIFVRSDRYLYAISTLDSAAAGAPAEKPGGTSSTQGRASGATPGNPGQASGAAAGDGILRAHRTLGTNADRSASLAFGDLDADGDLDLVVANGRHWAQQNEIFLNNGAGFFGLARPLGDERATSYAAPLADLDGDGDLDVAVGNDRVRNMVYLNDGTGRFTAGRRAGGAQAGTFGQPSSATRGVTLADLDGDGHADLVVTNRGEQNWIYFNDGRAGFERARPFGTSDDSTIAVAAADLDADGDLDLALANRDGQPNVCYLNDGEGRFERAGGFGTGTDETRGVAVADLNGDGHADLLSANIGEANGVHFGDGRGGFENAAVFGRPDGRSYAVRTADLDRDGDLDVVVGNAGAQNAILLNGGDGLTYEEQRFGDPQGVTYGVAVGDVDGDGYLDVAVSNSDGMNRVFINLSGRKPRHAFRVP